MISDALKYLTDLARAAAAPVKVESGDPRKLTYAVGGEFFNNAILPAPRGHAAGDLAEIVALANRFAMSDGTPAVWYDRARVVLVIDDGGHRLETVTLPLEPSDVFRRLGELAERPAAAWLELKPFLRLLRVELAGTLAPAALYERVRKLKFENGVTTTAEVTANRRESLGREIVSRVDAGADVPEEVTLEAPVYQTWGERERYALRCSVEVDAALGKLRLLPLPDELRRVADLAVASVGGRLRAGLDQPTPAYHGRP